MASGHCPEKIQQYKIPLPTKKHSRKTLPFCFPPPPHHIMSQPSNQLQADQDKPKATHNLQGERARSPPHTSTLMTTRPPHPVEESGRSRRIISARQRLDPNLPLAVERSAAAAKAAKIQKSITGSAQITAASATDKQPAIPHAAFARFGFTSQNLKKDLQAPVDNGGNIGFVDADAEREDTTTEEDDPVIIGTKRGRGSGKGVKPAKKRVTFVEDSSTESDAHVEDDAVAMQYLAKDNAGAALHKRKSMATLDLDGVYGPKEEFEGKTRRRCGPCS